MELETNNDTEIGPNVIYVPKDSALRVKHNLGSITDISYLYLTSSCRERIESIIQGGNVYIYSNIEDTQHEFSGPKVDTNREVTGNILVSLANISDQEKGLLGMLKPGNKIDKTDALKGETLQDLADRIGLKDIKEEVSLVLDRQLKSYELDDIREKSNIKKIWGIGDSSFGTLKWMSIQELSEENAVENKRIKN